MAEGWEEVAAAGSWIGTRAGTGGELNKHEGAGGAANRFISSQKRNLLAIIQRSATLHQKRNGVIRYHF
jgi:hypothetical protein